MTTVNFRNLWRTFLAAAMLLSLSVAAQAQEQITKPQLKKPVTRRRAPVRKPAAVVVPIGTNLKVRLNDTISSKTARVGDKFTVTVLDPVKYNEATVDGHVSSIIKSGKVKGKTTMNLAFDRITLEGGRSGVLHGYVSRVYGNEGGKADNEGGVESGSRTKQTIKRGGIGAAAGAIIGGLAGGGKGAAIGLLIGGAGGAGSLAIQGSKELKLENGTELLIHTTR